MKARTQALIAVGVAVILLIISIMVGAQRAEYERKFCRSLGGGIFRENGKDPLCYVNSGSVTQMYPILYY